MKKADTAVLLDDLAARSNSDGLRAIAERARRHVLYLLNHGNPLTDRRCALWLAVHNAAVARAAAVDFRLSGRIDDAMQCEGMAKEALAYMYHLGNRDGRGK